jgi:hypothetical protein
MMKWHFSGRIETIIPVTGKKPFSCPHCPFLGKDRQCVVRHYTGKYLPYIINSSISDPDPHGSASIFGLMDPDPEGQKLPTKIKKVKF